MEINERLNELDKAMVAANDRMTEAYAQNNYRAYFQASADYRKANDEYRDLLLIDMERSVKA